MDGIYSREKNLISLAQKRSFYALGQYRNGEAAGSRLVKIRIRRNSRQSEKAMNKLLYHAM